LHTGLHLIDRESFIRSSWNLRKRAIATEEQARESQDEHVQRDSVDSKGSTQRTVGRKHEK
jgi:hypothetical protein